VAAAHPETRATVGRIQPVPGGTNVIASRVDLRWDVRHPDDAVTAAVVGEIGRRAAHAAAEEGGTVTLHEESVSATVLAERLPTAALSPGTRCGCPTRPRSTTRTTTPGPVPWRWPACSSRCSADRPAPAARHTSSGPSPGGEGPLPHAVGCGLLTRCPGLR